MPLQLLSVYVHRLIVYPPHRGRVLAAAVMQYCNDKLMLVNGQLVAEESHVGGFRGEVYNTRVAALLSEGSLDVGLLPPNNQSSPGWDVSGVHILCAA